MFISEGSYGRGEPKNRILTLVQIAHWPVLACKLPGFIQRRIWPRMDICTNLELLIDMVPCLHQGNVHIKLKLWERRAWKCKLCFGADSPQTCTVLQTTWFHTEPFKTVNWNLRKFWATYRHGTMFCTKAMFISKLSYAKGQPKNVNLVSVLVAHRPVQAYKLPYFMQRRIGPTMEIYGNSGLLIILVLCLHQSNVHIRSKLLERRD